MKLDTLFLLGSLFIFLPAISFAAVTQEFSASPVTINSGQSVVLSWATANSSGASVLLPCFPGVKYRNQGGAAIACDTKIQNLGVADSLLLIVTNTSGSPVSVTPIVYPKNADGTEDLAAQKKTTFSVQTHTSPIAEFSASPVSIVSGETSTLSWSAPEVERMNMTMSCADTITAQIVGDDRPKVPCDYLLFLTDLVDSGSRQFKLSNTSLEPVTVKFKLMPKILNTGGFDGTHAKTVEITVRPVSQTQSPVITDFRIDPQTAKSGEDVYMSWKLTGGVGANFQLKCANAITATTSRTGSTVFGCGSGMMLPEIAGTSDIFKLKFQNPSSVSEEAEIVMLPAISTTQYDAIRARTLRLVIGGGGNSLQPTAAPTPVPPAVSLVPTPAVAEAKPVVSSLATDTRSALIGKKIAARSIPLGTRNSDEVRILQELLRKDGVFEGEATGNFLSGTEAAVKKFQIKHGIPAIGLVGPQTIAKLNEVSGNASVEVKPLPTQASPKATAARILAALRKGSRGDEVMLLQKILASDASVYPEGTISGFFGPATETALKRFQAKHGLDQVGSAGPKTRVKLNEIAEKLNIR